MGNARVCDACGKKFRNDEEIIKITIERETLDTEMRKRLVFSLFGQTVRADTNNNSVFNEYCEKCQEKMVLFLIAGEYGIDKAIEVLINSIEKGQVPKNKLYEIALNKVEEAESVKFENGKIVREET